MTKIMIDNIDVSRCDFYDKDRKYCLTLKMNPTGFKNPSCFSGDFQECIQDSKVCPYTFCNNNPNCYYKQLKRKKQECERLKRKLNPKLKNAHCAYFEGQTGLCKAKEFARCNPVNCKLYTIDELSTIVELQQQIDQLKAENEKLETDNKRLVGELANPVFDSFEELDKLKQSLQEIKDIAEQMNNECFYDDFDCKDCDMKKGCTHFNKKQILQKCEEVDADKT